jgi:hypothetical protein
MCDYLLVGLPDRHRCPECGFEYDRAMEVIAPKRGWMFWGLVGTIAIWWVYTVTVAIWAFRGAVLWASVLLIALLGVGMLRHVNLRSRRRVVIWGGGVLIIGRRRRPEVFEWGRIASLRREFVNGATLLSPEGNKVTFIPTSFLGSAANLDAFVMAFNRWKGRRHDDEAAANAEERGIPLSAEGDNESHQTGNTDGDK